MPNPTPALKCNGESFIFVCYFLNGWLRSVVIDMQHPREIAKHRHDRHNRH